MRLKFFLMIIGFAAVMMLFFVRLDSQASTPSRLMDRPLPEFSAETLDGKKISNKTIQGPAMINFFATWCVPCLMEHTMLNDMKDKGVKIYGINMRDEKHKVEIMVERKGNPFTQIILDPNSEVGFNFGITGLPETFMVDEAGIIRYHHAGPIQPDMVDDELMPAWKKLNGK